MNKLQQYEQAIRRNMAIEEQAMRNDENKRGFVVGAVRKLWEVWQAQEVDESQFDRLIEVFSGFDKGAYKDFIEGQVKLYKGGKPPIIIGY